MSVSTKNITGEHGWVTVIKPDDENRDSGGTGTTLTDDGTLFFPMAANTAYFIDMFIIVYIRANADFKYNVTVPASGFFRAMERATATHEAFTNNAIVSNPGSTAVTVTSGEGYGFIRWTGPYTNGANAGNWMFQWAQNTSHADDATVVAGSMIRYFRFK